MASDPEPPLPKRDPANPLENPGPVPGQGGELPLGQPNEVQPLDPDRAPGLAPQPGRHPLGPPEPEPRRR